MQIASQWLKIPKKVSFFTTLRAKRATFIWIFAPKFNIRILDIFVINWKWDIFRWFSHNVIASILVGRRDFPRNEETFRWAETGGKVTSDFRLYWLQWKLPIFPTSPPLVVVRDGGKKKLLFYSPVTIEDIKCLGD